MKTLSLLLAGGLCIIFLGVITPQQTFGQGNGVLLEFCTGTWCQWCPCGDQIAQQVLNSYPNTVVLAEHGGGGGDPFQNFPGNEINGASYHNWFLFPTGCVGRRTGSQVDRGDWMSTVASQSAMAPGVSIAVSKTYNPSTRVLNATIQSTALSNLAGNYYISYVITEDNVVYNQTGNGSCAGGSNYVHKWIVRAFTNTAQGTLLSTGAWTQGTTLTSTMSYTLPATWNDNNCKFAVFVYLQGGQFSTTSFIQQTKQVNVPGNTGVVENGEPREYSLSQNYPNPFNPTTNLMFSIPKDGNVSLKVFDILGKEVAVYLDGLVKAGSYNAEIDGTNLPSGVYYYTLNAEGFTQTKKMILIK